MGKFNVIKNVMIGGCISASLFSPITFAEPVKLIGLPSDFSKYVHIESTSNYGDAKKQDFHAHELNKLKNLQNGNLSLAKGSYGDLNGYTAYSPIDDVVKKLSETNNKFTIKKLKKEYDQIVAEIPEGDISDFLNGHYVVKLDLKGSYPFDFDSMSKAIAYSPEGCSDTYKIHDRKNVQSNREGTNGGIPYSTRNAPGKDLSFLQTFKYSDELASSVTKNNYKCRITFNFGDNEALAERFEDVTSDKPYALFGFYTLHETPVPYEFTGKMTHIGVFENTEVNTYKYVTMVGGNTFTFDTPLESYPIDMWRDRHKSPFPMEKDNIAIKLLRSKSMWEISKNTFLRINNPKEAEIYQRGSGFNALYDIKVDKYGVSLSLKNQLSKNGYMNHFIYINSNNVELFPNGSGHISSRDAYKDDIDKYKSEGR